MNKKLFIIMIVLVIACGAVFFVGIRKEQTNEKYYSQISSEVEDYEKQKQQLENQMNDLQKEYNVKINGIGTTEILFTNLDPTIYTDIYPMMEKYNYTGVLVFSPQEYPSQRDCLSLEQFLDLKEAGWHCCFGWDESQLSTDWIPAFEDELAVFNIYPDNVMYFPEETYQQSYDKELYNQGFRTIIHHGEEELPIVSSPQDNQLWHTGALPFRRSGIKKYLTEAMNEGGNVIFTVGFSLKEELYNEYTFESMLDTFKNYTNDQSLDVTNVYDARKYHLSIGEGQEGLQKEFDLKKKALEDDIKEIENKILDIYDSYREKD